MNTILKLALSIFTIIGTNEFSLAQNEVANPSFERKLGCPNNGSQIYLAQFWSSPTYGTPEYYNKCGFYTSLAGIQNSKTGNAHIGIFGYSSLHPDTGREYIQSKLIHKLDSGDTYNVSFYVSLGEVSNFGLSTLGVLFSENSFFDSINYIIPATPQLERPANQPLTDYVGWTKCEWTYTANGTEQFITIGNYRNDAQSGLVRLGTTESDDAYYFVDDISVCKLSGDCSEDTSIYTNISTTLDKSESLFNIYPNPSKQDFVLMTNSNLSNLHYVIVNMVGQKVNEGVLNKDISSYKIDIQDLNPDIYYVSILDDKSILCTQKLIIFK